MQDHENVHRERKSLFPQRTNHTSIDFYAIEEEFSLMSTRTSRPKGRAAMFSIQMDATQYLTSNDRCASGLRYVSDAVPRELSPPLIVSHQLALRRRTATIQRIRRIALFIQNPWRQNSAQYAGLVIKDALPRYETEHRQAQDLEKR